MIRGHILKKAICSPGKFPQITEIRVYLDNTNTYEKLRKLLLINCEKWKQIRERKIQISNLIQTLYP